jgi:hypothetical protein
MEADQIAQLAMSLRDNEAFQMALDGIRGDALDALVRADATDAPSIHKHQATVRVVDNLRADLDGFIRQGQAKTKPGLA